MNTTSVTAMRPKQRPIATDDKPRRGESNGANGGKPKPKDALREATINAAANAAEARFEAQERAKAAKARGPTTYEPRFTFDDWEAEEWRERRGMYKGPVSGTMGLFGKRKPKKKEDDK